MSPNSNTVLSSTAGVEDGNVHDGGGCVVGIEFGSYGGGGSGRIGVGIPERYTPRVLTPDNIAGLKKSTALEIDNNPCESISP